MAIELPADTQELSRRALEAWGLEAQTLMMTEEAAEFIVAVNHLWRGRATKGEVATEIADLLIMFEQSKVGYGITDEEIQLYINDKISRLRTRLEAHDHKRY
jgi:hypothetical protein